MDRNTQQKLLNIARGAIDARLKGLSYQMPEIVDPELFEPRGAFVTLHKREQLRGCIGTFAAEKPLCQTVADMAVSAAFNDPRFSPLTPSELDEVDIEISVLSPLREIRDTNEIQVGIHGIYLINGPFHGVLLPQVATEHGWDRETFLDQSCLKAGMGPGCWRDPTTKILIFCAEVFGEKEGGDSCLFK